MKLTPVVKKLCRIMIVVFLLQLVLPLQGFALFSGENFRFYQLITHMFMHGNPMHIISNLLIFVIFSQSVETYLGERKFVTLFILSGLVGALAQLISFNTDSAMLGASAAIYGTTMASILVEPDRKLYIFFLPIYIRAKYFILTLFIMEIFDIFLNSQDHIGHVAHVFGGIAGFIFLLFNRKIKNKSINL